MADYIFNHYAGENLYSPYELTLYSVNLALRESELSSFETGSSNQTWTYTVLKEFHTYYPEAKILVPFSANGSTYKAYAWANRNNFFPPELLGKAWLNTPVYRSGFESVQLVTQELAPRADRQPNDPQPPPRWELTFDFEQGYRVTPSYEDLITGFSRDLRKIPDKLNLISSVNQSITVNYYKLNPYEQIPNLEYIDPEADFVEPAYNNIDSTKSLLKSIDWYTQTFEVKKNEVKKIDITGIVMGTLKIDIISGSNLQLTASSDIGNYIYPTKYLLNNISDLDELFNYWNLLYNDQYIVNRLGINYLAYCYRTDRRLRFNYGGLARNGNFVTVAITEGFNDFWNNYSLPDYADYIRRPTMGSQGAFEAELYHPFFQSLPFEGDRASFGTYPNPIFRVFHKTRENYYPFYHANLIKWQLTPQIDTNGNFRGIGAITMDSPRVIEIHSALNAGKWGINPDDRTKPRKDDLGWRIQRTNEVLGIRVKTDGTIDEPLEKKQNRREHAEGTERNNLQEYNPNCFGSKGMLVRYLPNKFKPKGKDMETIEGGFRKIKDIPQYLAELHEQANAAMGYQEGTAIEITVDDETYRYPNQLALLTEIFVTLKQSGTYSKGAFFSSVVAEQSIKEVIGGLGLRTVDKYLEFKIAGKTAKLYYKGISASQSIRRKLSAISTNIGTIIGNIT